MDEKLLKRAQERLKAQLEAEHKAHVARETTPVPAPAKAKPVRRFQEDALDGMGLYDLTDFDTRVQYSSDYVPLEDQLDAINLVEYEADFDEQ